MIVKSKIATGLIIAALCASATQAAVPITGKWVTAEKNAIVEIYPCGGTICGKISKFLITPPQGAGQKDTNNPDKSLRGRTILGMTILSGFSAKGDQWNGTIYDPKAGKTYRSVVFKGTSGNLIVKGCIGPFCQSQTWTPSR